jgi:hypothetical protein
MHQAVTPTPEHTPPKAHSFLFRSGTRILPLVLIPARTPTAQSTHKLQTRSCSKHSHILPGPDGATADSWYPASVLSPAHAPAGWLQYSKHGISLSLSRCVYLSSPPLTGIQALSQEFKAPWKSDPIFLLWLVFFKAISLFFSYHIAPDR